MFVNNHFDLFMELIDKMGYTPNLLRIIDKGEGVYELSIHKLYHNSPVYINNPLEQLQVNQIVLSEVTSKYQDKELGNQSIEEFLENVDFDIRNLLNNFPTCLLNECISPYCSLTRSKTPIRSITESIMSPLIQKYNSICSLGCGYMFQDYMLLQNRSCTDLTYYTIENMRDYFECVLGDNEYINPCKYYGKIDDQIISRAMWCMFYTYRFTTFMELLGLEKMIICANGLVSYKSAIQIYSKPQLIMAIDIVDVYAQITIPLLYNVAKTINGCKVISISDGLICMFDIEQGDDVNVISYDGNTSTLYYFKLLQLYMETHDIPYKFIGGILLSPLLYLTLKMIFFWNIS